MTGCARSGRLCGRRRPLSLKRVSRCVRYTFVRKVVTFFLYFFNGAGATLAISKWPSAVADNSPKTGGREGRYRK